MSKTELNSQIRRAYLSGLSADEAEMLSLSAQALYYLNEAEPSLYSQSMARSYVRDIQQRLTRKQQKPLDAEPI
jgi:hypothetical protein